jgi:hypothetical protein
MISKSTKLPHVRHLCNIEMVARACKVIFRERLRKALLHYRQVGAAVIDQELRSLITGLFCDTLGKESQRKKAGFICVLDFMIVQESPSLT